MPITPASPPRPATALSMHWLILGLMLALLGTQMAYDLWQIRAHIEDEAKSRLENHSLVLLESLERQLRSADTALFYLRDTVPTHLAQAGGAAHLASELRTLTQALEGVRTLSMLDAKGDMRASSRPELIGRNFAEREYFQTLQRAPSSDRLHVSQPFVTALGVHTVTLSRPLHDARGNFAGIVVATLNADGLRNLLQAQHAGADTRLAVVHGNGTLLKLVPEREAVPSGTDVGKPDSFFRRHLASGQPASLMTGRSGATGTLSFASLRTLQPAVLQMDTPLVVVAARDQDNILAAWRNQVRQRATLFLLVAFGAALALWFYRRHRRDFERQIQRKEMERQRSVLTLQRFIDHFPGIAYVKDADSRTLMANRGFLTLLGMDPTAMIGKTSEELFPGAFGEKITADDQTVLASGKTVTIEESLGDRDYASTKFVIDDGAGPRQLGGITLDITARKTAERTLTAQMAHLQELNRHLETTQSQLLQAEKMASIGQLAAGVAHEINNPIGFVGSNLSTLASYLDDLFHILDACERAAAANPDQLAGIQAIQAERDFAYIKTDIFTLLAESADGLQRVKKIVQDLKDFSRPGEACWELTDLHQGLDSTLNMVWNELKYTCTIRKEYGDLPRIRCLPAQINQVFMNLLTNAGQAIREKGEIVIRTGRRDAEVFVAIADNGVGIAPENLNHLFEPFFTTKPVGQGTGLGLSLSYATVQKHQGRIEVDSTPGQGTTFTVWLPIEAAAADTPPSA